MSRIVGVPAAIKGAFRFTRHPGNLGALGFFLFMPRMTANRAVLTALVTLYVVLARRVQAAGGVRRCLRAL
jgi:protein-S-isoprenylcysteine O-methyltransferase Ste14